MHERDYTLNVKDMFGYFNDDEVNPHNELLKDFELLLKTHRAYINGLSHSEYQEHKKKQNKYIEQNRVVHSRE